MNSGNAIITVSSELETPIFSISSDDVYMNNAMGNNVYGLNSELVLMASSDDDLGMTTHYKGIEMEK